MKQPLSGLSLTELEAMFPALPPYRIKQLFKWLVRGVSDFDQMTDIPAPLKKQLQEQFTLFSGSVTACLEDEDTKKIVITLHDGFKIESVLLRDGKNRLTACISTQAGCPAGCVFCKTGSLGFKRNLSSGEIIEQYFHLKCVIEKNLQRTDTNKYEQEKAKKNKKKVKEHIIDNIVVMGMGEPLLNLDNLKKAVDYFNDKAGLNFSRRRITVSTCGICGGLFEIANAPFSRLALSLTTGDEELRGRLMPITRSNPLNKVHQALKLFQDNGGGRVTLEVPLLGGINSRYEDAKSIADFAKGLDTVVNIIPWNPVAGFVFEGKPLCEPSKKETADFVKSLESFGLKITMRLHKGQRIMGACGQLGGD